MKVALCQINSTLGNFELNSSLILKHYKMSKELNADIVSGHKSTLLMQLGNIAQRTGRSLNINPENGHIIKDREANKLWKRSYEKGWEMNL